MPAPLDSEWGLVLYVGILSFGAGFMAHYWRWHDRVRPFLLYWAGRTGGCTLRQSLAFKEDPAAQLSKEIAQRSKLLRQDGALELWGTPRGQFWIPATTTSLFYILAEQQLRIYTPVGHEVRKGDIVLDCGANVGVFTAEALAAGARLVVAVEPVPNKVECLSRNFKSEIEAGRVVVRAQGLWEEETVLKMMLYKDTVMDSFVLPDRGEDVPTAVVELPVTTIDKLVSELGLTRIDVIKMDVEGANNHVLRGARQTLNSAKPRLSVATEDVGGDFKNVVKDIQSLCPGYRSRGGPCSLQSRFQIGPNVLYFWWPSSG
jgi:FkbM family methyltransferase